MTEQRELRSPERASRTAGCRRETAASERTPSLHEFRSRFFYRTLDAAVTAVLKPRKDLLARILAVVSPRSSNFRRVSSLVSVVNSVVPGVERCVVSRLCSPRHLPFSGVLPKLIGYGSGATVFLLDGPDSRWVLKIYRRSLGQSARSLSRMAVSYRDKYATVSSWYPGSTGVVAPASFLTLNSPLLGCPATACLQKYVSGRSKDFFEDVSLDELRALMRKDAAFREQVTQFASSTIAVSSAKGLCADLLGRENLLITFESDRPVLRLIDYGIHDLNTLEKTSPRVRARLERRLTKLRSLLESTP